MRETPRLAGAEHEGTTMLAMPQPELAGLGNDLLVSSDEDMLDVLDLLIVDDFVPATPSAHGLAAIKAEPIELGVMRGGRFDMVHPGAALRPPTLSPCGKRTASARHLPIVHVKNEQSYSDGSTPMSWPVVVLPSEVDQPRFRLNPRDFVQLCEHLGADVVCSEGSTIVRLAHEPLPLLRNPISRPLETVEHEMTYVMSGSIPLKERRRFDCFSNLEMVPGERTFWCDQGNAHCVLDTAKPLRLTASKNEHINPRTIQVAHALAARVSSLLDTELPVVKCFYYSLHSRNQNKRKRKADGTKAKEAASTALGLHKHIYILCAQDVDDRHQLLEGSQVWLVRYFAKEGLHPTLRPSVIGDVTAKRPCAKTT